MSETRSEGENELAPTSVRRHAVVVNEGFRFPVRNGATTRYLSESEVAAAYRERDAHVGERAAKLADALDATLSGVNRDQAPWIHVALVPEHPGSLEINQRMLREMQRQYQGKDVHDVERSGASFDWVRPGRGKYVLGDGPYPNGSSPLPHYGYSELHINGTGGYAVALVDMTDARRQNNAMAPDPAADQMVSDEAVALGILSGLHRLAAHARNSTATQPRQHLEHCAKPTRTS